ncbi:Uu.00g011690.m01.CDS01 [Anthostomella pinea]|uniref:Uu.00g011690.m01.CDS01 n=1 Tax=Anthostomella pinea TaxID=933095 RepID=A0AAI8VYQ3_9PEZI|nr:Uu.00g011690.m01.CDS01 [Anthostomella pinea]
MSNKQAAKKTDQLKEYFEKDSRNFKLEKPRPNRDFLGRGGFGITYLFREEQEDGTLKRKFVVKFATRSTEGTSNEMQTEIRIAKKLYGALHIAQPIVDEGEMRKLDNLPENADKLFSLLLCTEFLPNGTLFTFRMKAMNAEQPIPNRILWMIFLCLVRMVIAMANPPDRGYRAETAAPQLEELAEPGYYQIEHGDLNNPSNLVFGDFDIIEHNLVPIVKCLDFGMFMSQLFAYKGMPNPKETPDPKVLFPNLDMELYDLAGRCAVDITKDSNYFSNPDRPSLTELFTAVRNAVTTKTGPDHFLGLPFTHPETDEEIQKYVQKMILSA